MNSNIFMTSNENYLFQGKKSVLKSTMDSRDLVVGLMILLQTAVGILGNSSLLSHYVGLYCKKFPFKPSEVILTHLIVANFLIIFSKGIPRTMAAFGSSQTFSEVGCSLLLYVRRVGRNVSIGSTCLLSVFQFITISPKNSCWKDLKVKIQSYVCLCISLFWILYLVVNFIFPLYVFTKWKFENKTRKITFDYCSISGSDELTDSLYLALLVFPEVLFSGLIVWSSSSMIVILHRHKQRVQYIHSIQGSPRVSPETRVAQSILALVFTFLTFYTISALLHGYIALSYNPHWWLVNISSLLSVSFPAVGPFVLISHEATVIKLCLIQIRKTKPPNAIISI